MNKEEQINEMAKTIYKTIRKDCALNNGGHCTDCEYMDKDTDERDCQSCLIAETLYNAGYRKTFTSELASDMQKAFKEGYEKGCEMCKQAWDNGYNDGFEDGKEQVEKDSYERGFEDGKTIAVKEFAEKLKERITDDHGTQIATLTVKGIEEILKEYLGQ